MRLSKILAVAACATALVISGCASPKQRRSSARPAATKTAKPAPNAPGTAGNTAAAPLDARYTQAVQLVKSSQWQAAETAMAAMAKAYPQYSGPQTNLGIIYLRTNRKEPALAAFTRAVNLNPRNAVAQTGLGILAAAAGDTVRAEQAYRAALAADSGYGVAHLNLGILYDRNLNRPDAALKEYRLYRDNGGKDDLKAALWIADLEQRAATTPAPSAPASPGTGS